MTLPTDALRYYRSAQVAAEIAELYASILDEWPVPSSRHTLGTSQGDTFVIECGTPGAPPLLLIHGAIANSATWFEDVMTWAPHFHLYAVDVIGEPGFSAPARPPLASDAYARWLDDVLDGLGMGTTAVAGVSLGGWLGFDCACSAADERAQPPAATAI